MKNYPNEIANLFYQLLSNEDEVVCSDKEQLNSSISKTLATVLLATFLSQLLDFAKSEFFTSLMKKK